MFNASLVTRRYGRPNPGAPVAAESIAESARRHERFADAQDHAIEHGIPDADVHRESAALHRKAAARDRKLAELKRKESEADLSG